MDIEEHQPLEGEEQIMIMIEGLDDPEDECDLLDKLVAEPAFTHNPSLNYDYRPAPINSIKVEELDTQELKISNTSASTCAEVEAPVRRCFCSKTRCQKNYCECFKLGEACTSDCECIGCGNRQRLFLTRSDRGVTKCKCPKSHCLKKYCQCQSAGKKCGPACQCFECENIEEHTDNHMVAEETEQGGRLDIDQLLFFK